MKLLAIMGAIFTTILCLIAYFPLRDRLAQADFMSLSYGLMLYQFLPLFLTVIAVFSGVTIMYISAKGGYTQK